MQYAFLLKPHANVRYRQSLQKLALLELECMLESWGMTNANPRVQLFANEMFLTFESDGMSDQAWAEISRHSSVCLAAEVLQGGMLRPIERKIQSFVPDDLPHVLKYKGKTNADFTAMMLHCAKAASAFENEGENLRVLDPMCGKATTLFCALCEGYDAIGVDTDHKALQETDGYVERSLKMHRVKHRRAASSRTLSGGGSARATVYTLAQDAETMKQGKTLSLELLHGDAARVAEMVKPGSIHLIASDLPYGVQHAPKENGGMSSLGRLIQRVAPGCVKALKPGGALAFSFNLNTLPRKEVVQALEQAGLHVLNEGPYADFSHWVEQAVERDIVVARKE